MHCEERSSAPKPSADTQVFSDFLMWFFIKCQRLKLATDHKRTRLHNDMVAVAVLCVFVCVIMCLRGLMSGLMCGLEEQKHTKWLFSEVTQAPYFHLTYRVLKELIKS